MKHNPFAFSNSRQRYSVRKSYLGVCSVLLGTILLLSVAPVVSADESGPFDISTTLLEPTTLTNDEQLSNNTGEDTLSSKDNVSSETESGDSTLPDESESLSNDVQAGVAPEVVVQTDSAKEEVLKADTENPESVVATPVSTRQAVVPEEEKEAFSRVSVHDPSIFYDEKTGTYYVFGSHLAQAKSDDLQNWTPLFTREYENPSSVLGDLNENLASVFEWAGYDDADTAGGRYSVWAPDVLWNPSYQWEDGTTGAYMYYFSSSSTWRRSVIGYAVSKSVEGPYDFKDTLIYSGFTKENATDGSSRNIHYTNTHIDELINKGVIVEGFNEKWNRDNGHTYDNDYAPNAIDANVFFDKDNRLYMSYGSWSGGIYLLELDPATGKAIYPGVDGKTPDGRRIDRYFGTHLLGGWHQSGEAPYIVYDANTDYYYLFITYGGLTREGGYNMRLFRSKTVDGLYVDTQGNNPQYTGWTPEPINTAYGLKVMGNYNFNDFDAAYMSPGHNSAFIDENGDWYLVYHTRFDQGSEYHEVRVHRMVMTEEGWPVALPYEFYEKEKALTLTSDNGLTGEYEFVNHGTDSSGRAIPKASVTLHEDGTVSGGFTGIWTSVSQDGLYRLNLTSADGHVYKGQFALQYAEKSSQVKLVFALVGDDNTVFWGSKDYEVKEPVDDTEEDELGLPETIDKPEGEPTPQETPKGDVIYFVKPLIPNHISQGTIGEPKVSHSGQSEVVSEVVKDSEVLSLPQRIETDGEMLLNLTTSSKYLPKTGDQSRLTTSLGALLISLFGVLPNSRKKRK
ncbi:LPXTG-motif cell wall-anchored protein [Streptococcus rupicaprae]|uniref:LPXTG-motif cell wall-anchored protein n=1 Tax=Streptococcus rupicaprae TaxID=759619 RepID=A0ABV2FK10_9STRE